MDANELDLTDIEAVRMYARRRFVDGGTYAQIGAVLGYTPGRVSWVFKRDSRRTRANLRVVKSQIWGALRDAWSRGELLEGVNWPADTVSQIIRSEATEDVMLFVPSWLWNGATILMLATVTDDEFRQCPMTTGTHWAFVDPDDAIAAAEIWQRQGYLPTSWNKRHWKGLRRACKWI